MIWGENSQPRVSWSFWTNKAYIYFIQRQQIHCIIQYRYWSNRTSCISVKLISMVKGLTYVLYIYAYCLIWKGALVSYVTKWQDMLLCVIDRMGYTEPPFLGPLPWREMLFFTCAEPCKIQNYMFHYKMSFAISSSPIS